MLRSNSLASQSIEVITAALPIPGQDLMTDPVILCNTGVSYERSSIEAWISNYGCATPFQLNAPRHT